jgi:hypothetical protein
MKFFEKGGVNQIVPPGTIVAYYPQNGDLKSNPVPLGWVVCDGNNGTPDLRGRFLCMYSDDIIPNRNEVKQILKIGIITIGVDMRETRNIQVCLAIN